MGYFKVCPHCGANLDPGEHCDCMDSKYERLNSENREAVRRMIDKLIEEQKTARGATNTTDGKAEKVLTGSDSASNDT